MVPGGWTTRYAARRIAWHVLEYVWEMQPGSPGMMHHSGFDDRDKGA